MAEKDRQSGTDPQPVAARDALGIIFNSATDAFGSAFVVWILGDVAISIAGSFASGMVPSLPPGFGPSGGSEGRHSGSQHPWWNAVRCSTLGLFFAIFFVHSLWVGFHGGGTGRGKRIERILSNVRENWFGLIVGNAITAWFAILILSVIPDFSLLKMLWHWVSAMVTPVLQQTGRFIFGEAGWASAGTWFSWYEDNQLKLDFWIIYIGSAFDDLGVPNLKTLARWVWRWPQRRNGAALPAQAESRDAA